MNAMKKMFANMDLIAFKTIVPKEKYVKIILIVWKPKSVLGVNVLMFRKFVAGAKHNLNPVLE